LPKVARLAAVLLISHPKNKRMAIKDTIWIVIDL